MTPDIRYSRSGDVNIAYQVVGDSPRDLGLVPGWVTNLEVFWEEPACARFLQWLASFTRLILFDKRGTGLSDRVADLPTRGPGRVDGDVPARLGRPCGVRRPLTSGAHDDRVRQWWARLLRMGASPGANKILQQMNTEMKGVPGEWHLFALEPESQPA